VDNSPVTQKKKKKKKNGRPFAAEAASYPDKHKSLQKALPVAEVHMPCMGTHMVTLAIFLAFQKPAKSQHVNQNKPSTCQFLTNSEPSLSIVTKQRSNNVQIHLMLYGW